MAACHHDYKNTRKDFTSTTKQGVQQVTFSSFLIVCLIIVVRLYVEDKFFTIFQNYEAVSCFKNY